MTLPELAKGRGVTLGGEVKIGREQYPGDGSVASRMREALAQVPAAKDAAALAFLAVYALGRRLARRSRRDERC